VAVEVNPDDGLLQGILHRGDVKVRISMSRRRRRILVARELDPNDLQNVADKGFSRAFRTSEAQRR